MNQVTTPDSRAKRLKARTEATHDLLDKSIMAANPFASRENYLQFAQMQHRFHRDIAMLFNDPALIALIPDLPSRQRLDDITQDLADLGATPDAPDAAPALAGDVDLPTALGWLYVAEGSNLGAAFLRKFAAKLGLSDDFGARHLAGAPEGRARHWQSFTAALDAVDLTAEQDTALTAGADAAFARVHALVKESFGQK